MKCPTCGSLQTRTINSRLTADGKTKRRHSCRNCKVRFSTIEVVVEEYEDLKDLEASVKKLLDLANK